MLRVLVADRQRGKTTAAIDWIAVGVRVTPYPGWSRALVVMHDKELERLRDSYWSVLEDFDHRVYALSELGWKAAKWPGMWSETELCVDNLDLIAFDRDLSRLPARVTAVTMTGELWTPAFTPMVQPTPGSGS